MRAQNECLVPVVELDYIALLEVRSRVRDIAEVVTRCVVDAVGRHDAPTRSKVLV
jgi:hypothetical protein